MTLMEKNKRKCKETPAIDAEIEINHNRGFGFSSLHLKAFCNFFVINICHL